MQTQKTDKIIYIALYILGISSTFALPINYFFGIQFYKFASLALLVMTVLILVIEKMNKPIKFLKTNTIQIFSISAAFSLSIFISIFILPVVDVLISLSGYVFYVAPLFLITFTSFFKERMIIDGYIKLNVYFSLIIGLLSVYQLLYDPLLFGIYAKTAYEDFDSWGVRRASSLMDSIQVYSCYMAFSLWSIIFLKPFSNSTINFVLAAIVGVFGLAGASQTYVILMLAYYAITLGIKILIPILIFTSIILLGGSNILIEDGGPLARFSSITTDGVSTFHSLNSDRLDVWKLVIENTNLVYGNGLGSASVALSGGDRFNTESYFLNIYYEGGLIFLVPYLIFIFSILWRNHKIKYLNRHLPHLFSLTFLIYGISVHAYYSVMLFYVWFLFFFLPRKSTSNKIN